MQKILKVQQAITIKTKESGWCVKYGNTYYNPPLKLIVLPFLEKLECSAKMQRSLSTSHIEKSNCFFLPLLCVLQWQALSVKFHTCVKLSTVKNEGSHFNSGLSYMHAHSHHQGRWTRGGAPLSIFWNNKDKCIFNKRTSKVFVS